MESKAVIIDASIYFRRAVLPLDKPGISAAYGVLIHIVGGEDWTLDEVAAAGERIVDKVPEPGELYGVPGWTALLLAECASWQFS